MLSCFVALDLTINAGQVEIGSRFAQEKQLLLEVFIPIAFKEIASSCGYKFERSSRSAFFKSLDELVSLSSVWS